MTSKVSAVDKKTNEALEVVQLDPVWEKLRQEAQDIIDNDAAMSGFVYGNVLNQSIPTFYLFTPFKVQAFS